MADQKISELTALTGANLADVDAFAVVDTSAVQTKKITYAELKTALDTGTGFVRITGDTMTGNLSFGDNNKIILGGGSDLQIYHNGSNSYIDDAGTGNLFVRANNLRLSNADNSQYYLIADNSGFVKLNYSGSEKLATTSTGISVTGNATFADNGKAIFGGGSDLQIYHTGSASYIDDAGDGNLFIRANDFRLGKYTGEFYLKGNSDGNVELYYDNALKLATTATGIDVTGTVTADGLTVESGTSGITVDTSVSLSPEIKPSQALSDLIVSGAGNGGHLKFKTNNNDRVKIDGGTGDISFYEDTGTTPKLFWDASAESLGIGTSAPSASYSIDTAKGIRSSGAAPNFTLQETDASNQTWLMGSYGGSFAIRDTTVAGTSYPFKIEAAAPSNTLYLDSSGNVGIGITSSLEKFTVANASSGIVGRFTNNTNQTLDLGVISGSGAAGGVYYNSANSGYHAFQVGGTEHMRIDGGGNAIFTKSGGAYLQLKDASAVRGAINVETSDGLIFTTGSSFTERMRIDSSGHAIIPAGVTLGTSAGVYNAANTLDDYEEGDYDCTITCQTSGTVSLLGNFNRASYTKVGRLVTVNGFLIVDSVSSPVGYFTINLPFTPAALTDRAGDSTACLVIQNVVSANISDFVGTLNENLASLIVQLGDATTVQNDSAQQLAANTYIHFSTTYSTA